MIDRNSERRRLERQNDDVEELVREQLANDGVVTLGIGNVQGFVPSEDSCCVEETDDFNR